MTDQIDSAQEREQLDTEMALAAARQRIEASFKPRADGIDGICIDCDEPIEPARLHVLAGKTSRCASCAHDHEQRTRGYR